MDKHQPLKSTPGSESESESESELSSQIPFSLHWTVLRDLFPQERCVIACFFEKGRREEREWGRRSVGGCFKNSLWTIVAFKISGETKSSHCTWVVLRMCFLFRSFANLVSTCIYMFPTVFVFPQFEFLSVFKNFCIVPLRFARTVDRTRLYFEIKTVFLDLSLSHILSSNFSRYSELCYVPRECLAGLAVTK